MQNSFKVNRPLLNVHRLEIRQFVRFWKLPIYSDQSNEKTNYLRNKIRKQLMPTLRIFFNPQIDTVLLNFVEIQKNEQLYFRNVLKLLLTPQKCHSLFVFSFNLSNPYCSLTEFAYHDSFDDSFLSDLSFLAWYSSTVDGKNFTFDKQKASSASLFIKSKQKKRFIAKPTVYYLILSCYLFTKEYTKEIFDFNESTYKSGFKELKAASLAVKNKTFHRSFGSFGSKACIAWIYTKELKFIQTLDNQENDLNTSKKNCAKLIIQYKDYLDCFSRNQIIYWLIINNNLIKKLNSYPNIFQKQVLKTILKTFDQVENAINTITRSTHYLSGLFSDQKFKKIYQNKQLNEQKLTQLLILKFTKKLFVSREKRFLLIMLQDLINKY